MTGVGVAVDAGSPAWTQAAAPPRPACPALHVVGGGRAAPFAVHVPSLWGMERGVSVGRRGLCAARRGGDTPNGRPEPSAAHSSTAMRNASHPTRRRHCLKTLSIGGKGEDDRTGTFERVRGGSGRRSAVTAGGCRHDERRRQVSQRVCPCGSTTRMSGFRADVHSKSGYEFQEGTTDVTWTRNG